MPEQLSEAHRTLRDAMQRFCEDELAKLESELLEGAEETEIRERVIDASKQAGFYSMTQPRSLGGAEADALALTVVREALASANQLVGRYVFASGPGVLGASEGQLRESYLMPLMRGEKRGAFAFTEPEDTPRRTWATRDGDQLVISGRKAFVTGGDTADFVSALVNVEADADNPKGTAMVVIDMDAPGLTIESTFRSLEGGTHCGLRFSEVRVPLWHVVGRIGEGMPRALGNISNVRLMLSARACGVMQWAIERVTHHLTAPHRSGSPLATREGVRLRYAELRIQAYAARSMLYRTARLVASGDRAINEVMATKIFCTETAGHVVDTAVQLMGANALIQGDPLERLYREVRSMRFTEGASDVLRLNIAKGQFDLGKGTI